MTKDELNEVLKEDDLELDKQFNGIGKAEFIVRTIYSPNKQAINFNGVDFYVQDRSCFSPWTLKALADYANTPTEERKPKPQLYNIIIAEDAVADRPFLTVWGKDDSLGEYSVNICVEHYELLHNDYFKFTVEEIEDLKSKVSEKQKQIIDIGMVKVGEKMPAMVDTTNGYEVDKEIAQYVKFKGLDGSTGYLNYDVNFHEFFIDSSESDSCTKVGFTESWLKDNWSEYEAYNNAGLLEFEEVAS